MSLMSSIFGDLTPSATELEGKESASTLFKDKPSYSLPRNSPAALSRNSPKESKTPNAEKKESSDSKEQGYSVQPKSSLKNRLHLEKVPLVKSNSDDSSVDTEDSKSPPRSQNYEEQKTDDRDREDRNQKQMPKEDDTKPRSVENRKVNDEVSREKRLDEEKRTIFVGNLPPDTSRKALANIFKQCGNVASSRLRSIAVAGVKLPPQQAGNQKLMRKVCANTGKLLNDSPKKSAQGYVVFESHSSVEKALRMNNTTYQSFTLRVDFATPTIEPSRSVFVGNLPYGAEEESLREHFLTGCNGGDIKKHEEETEIVTGVRIIRDKETHKCKGFGYIILRDASAVPLALQMHGSSYMKRNIRVLVSGKRFKGNRGEKAINDNTHERSFEGLRSTPSTAAKPSGRKRKSESRHISGDNGKLKRRRGQSGRNTSKGHGASAPKSGLSKRAMVERKVDRKVKKLKQRAAKGMGKAKK